MSSNRKMKKNEKTVKSENKAISEELFILAGKTFGEETESNRIYAYSACVLAMVSCILSLVALLRV